MNRSQKIALLTKVIQGDAPARQLQQAALDEPRQGLIIICSGQRERDPASFTHNGQQHQMPLGKSCQYAQRHRMGTIFILPAKNP